MYLSKCPKSLDHCRDAALGSGLPAHRCRGRGIGFGTTRAPTAGVQRWVRNYSRAEGADPRSSKTLLKRRSTACKVGYGVTHARVGGVHRRVLRYPYADPRRPATDTTLPKRRPRWSNVAYSDIQSRVGGIGDRHFDLHRWARRYPSAKRWHLCSGRCASSARQRRAQEPAARNAERR
jgi:hypothetical protein